VLVRWCAVDPEWRIVRIGRNHEGVQTLKLTHIKRDADFDIESVEVVCASFEPEDVTKAIAEAMRRWLMMYGPASLGDHMF